MPTGRTVSCPSCQSQMQIFPFAGGWLGRYGECPHCHKKLALVFARLPHEWTYNATYVLTWIYAALAAEEFSHHFANPDSFVSRICWSLAGIFCALVPGYRVSAWLAEKWGSINEGDLKTALRSLFRS